MPDASTVSKIDDERAAEVRRQQGPLDNETASVLTRVYLARRLEYQLNYYKAKEREYINSSGNAFRFSALIMTITSVLAAIGVSDSSPPFLALLTVILPSAAALVTSFRSLYQWETQAQLYKDTALGLERAKLTLPDLDQVDMTTAAKVFPKLVSTAELVFEDEVNQWGQIALGDEDKEAESDANIAAFAREYGLDVFDDEGNLDDSKLDAYKDILNVSQSPGKANLSIEYPAMGAGRKKTGITATAEAARAALYGNQPAAEAEIEVDGDETSGAIDATETDEDLPDLSAYLEPVETDAEANEGNEVVSDLSALLEPDPDDDAPGTTGS